MHLRVLSFDTSHSPSRIAIASVRVHMPSTDPSNKKPSTSSNAGITLDSNGQQVIPSSIRPDGTTRREIRVRPGYRPPEDVEVYKNMSAEAWKHRGTGSNTVPGAAPTEAVSEGNVSNKNSKRRAARKRAKTRESEIKPSIATSEATTPCELTTSDTTQEENEKRAKSIRKKIRQANELKSRRDDGESLLPEQLDKIIKMNELVRQLNALGLDK
ncbi:hypothetical protein EDC01DRAFT_658934 [Geopyxis carbonaria]|nr:hypothetical protein EDC01DRAFT_658934 [Geopyxis carbonaria]